MSTVKKEPYSAKIYFILLTLFYIILKQTTIFDADKKKAISYAISYALLIFITQYFVNLNICTLVINIWNNSSFIIYFPIMDKSIFKYIRIYVC